MKTPLFGDSKSKMTKMLIQLCYHQLNNYKMIIFLLASEPWAMFHNEVSHGCIIGYACEVIHCAWKPRSHLQTWLFHVHWHESRFWVSMHAHGRHSTHKQKHHLYRVQVNTNSNSTRSQRRMWSTDWRRQSIKGRVQCQWLNPGMFIILAPINYHTLRQESQSKLIQKQPCAEMNPMWWV